MNQFINEIILKKNKNYSFTKNELKKIISAFDKKQISDKTMGIFLKAIQKYKLNDQETFFLFEAVLQKSKIIEINPKEGYTIDKHSTGGIGDKVSIILLPLLAYFQIKSFKFSGGRLGHTGGTLDKLKSFPNIKLDYSLTEFIKETKKNQFLITLPVKESCELESRIYKLRTLTDTTKSVDLIVNSILIKKILIKNQGLLLDIKIGKGSLFNNKNEIKRFTHLVKKICEQYNRPYKIIYSNMEQPLGRTVGNKMEVVEAIQTLLGNGESDVIDLVSEFSAHALIFSKQYTNFALAKKDSIKIINNGLALPFFKKGIQNQKGNWDSIFNNQIPKVKYKITLYSEKSGYFWFINAQKIGDFFNLISINKNEKIDYEAGMKLLKKNNDKVKKGAELLIFYTNNENIEELKLKAEKIFTILPNKKKMNPTVIKNFF